MENNDTSSKKVYTEKQISLGTFFGGPLASGILISKNYKILGNGEAAKKAVYLGILGTILLILFFYLSPNSVIDKIPNQLIPFINIGIVYLIVYFFQKEKLNNFLKEGGTRESYWKTIGIGLLCSVVILFFLFIVLFNKASYDGDVKTFGILNNTIYYDSSIPASDIDITGRVLTQIGFFDNEFQREIQIRDEGNNNYNIYLGADKELWDDEEVKAELIQLANIVQNSLSNKKIHISLYYEGLSKTETKRIN